MSKDSCFFVLSGVFAIYFMVNELFIYNSMKDEGRIEYQHSLEEAGIGSFQLNYRDELKFVIKNKCE